MNENQYRLVIKKIYNGAKKVGKKGKSFHNPESGLSYFHQHNFVSLSTTYTFPHAYRTDTSTHLLVNTESESKSDHKQ